MVACEKEAEVVPAEDARAAVSQELLLLPTQAEEVAKGKPTVLGRMRGNPYATDVMRAATTELYGDEAAAAVQTTDLYVKFNPRDFQEHVALEEEAFITMPFDLRREMVYLGEEYREPGLAEDEISPQYAVFPVGEEIPARYDFEVLAELHHPHVDSVALLRAAFASVDEVYPEEEERGLSKRWGSSCYDAWGNMEPCPPRFTDGPDVPTTTGGGNGGGNPACGCDREDNYRIIAGCVQVEDRGNPAAVNVAVPNVGNREVMPVVGVQVQAWNGFFALRQDHTNNDGCFEIPGEWSRSFRVRIWNKWRNSRVKMHAWTPGTGSAMRLGLDRDLGSYSVRTGTGLNRMNIIYTNINGRDSRSQVWYQACHSVNSVARAWQYSGEQGVPTPPEGLRYVIANVDRGAGAAPMLKQTGADWLAVGIVGVIVPQATPAAVFLRQLIPDVWQNYGNRTAANGVTQGSAAQDVPMHEMGHTVHYAAAGRWPWLENVTFIISVATERTLDNNNPRFVAPYGDGTVPGSGWCATIETWGEYYGASAMGRFYGDEFSAGVSPAVAGLEGMVPGPVGVGNDLWIPEGLPLDLEDDASPPWEGMRFSTAGPRQADAVQGLAMANYFRAMTTGNDRTPNPQQVRNRIITNFLPPGQTAAAITDAFDTYGY